MLHIYCYGRFPIIITIMINLIIVITIFWKKNVLSNSTCCVKSFRI